MTPNFINERTKSKNITAIKKAGKKADMIVLASDPDREGEAIA
jgi:DNA topoisomerase-1